MAKLGRARPIQAPRARARPRGSGPPSGPGPGPAGPAPDAALARHPRGGRRAGPRGRAAEPNSPVTRGPARRRRAGRPDGPGPEPASPSQQVRELSAAGHPPRHRLRPPRAAPRAVGAGAGAGAVEGGGGCGGGCAGREGPGCPPGEGRQRADVARGPAGARRGPVGAAGGEGGGGLGPVRLGPGEGRGGGVYAAAGRASGARARWVDWTGGLGHRVEYHMGWTWHG